MRYDVKIGGYLKDTYSEFEKSKVFYLSHEHTLETMDDVIRLGICYVDRKFPGKSRVLSERIEQAIEYVQPIEEAAEIARKNEKVFLDIIYYLFWLYHDTEMELWLTHKMNYHNLTKDMREGYMKTNDNLKISKDIDNYLNNLLLIENRIFDDPFLKELVNERESVKQLSGFAEKFALNFQIKKK